MFPLGIDYIDTYDRLKERISENEMNNIKRTLIKLALNMGYSAAEREDESSWFQMEEEFSDLVTGEDMETLRIAWRFGNLSVYCSWMYEVDGSLGPARGVLEAFEVIYRSLQ